MLEAEERWEEVLRVSQECFERLGYRHQYSEALAYIALDRREELERLIQSGLLDDNPGLREPLPWVILIRAIIQAYLGERQVAEGYFDQAIADFERRGGRIGLARSYHRRALFRQAGGQIEPALADARRAAELFQTCGAKRDALKAQALAAVLESAVK